MSTETLVFFKQLLENVEYANETGVLNVVGHFKDSDPDVTQGTSYALGAFETLERLLERRPELLTPAVVAQLELLAGDPDARVSSAARAALETGTQEETTPDAGDDVPQRSTPASARMQDLAEVRDRLEREFGSECPDEISRDDAHAAIGRYLKEQFAPPDQLFFILTPGELCDLVECYADQLSVGWSEGRSSLLSAESDVLVRLNWLAHPTWHVITVAGLYAFQTPRDAREVWLAKGAYREGLPLESLLGVRDRFALNFSSREFRSESSLEPEEFEEISPGALWPRIWRYCKALGAPLQV